MKTAESKAPEPAPVKNFSVPEDILQACVLCADIANRTVPTGQSAVPGGPAVSLIATNVVQAVSAILNGKPL